jgi:LacI family transcriptional regulator
MAKPHRKVTQATIAQMFGVSRQTVGCALGLYTNSNIKLSLEMRDRIVAAAKELGYRPNRLAQIISGRRSRVIGVVNFGGIAQMSSQHALNIAKAVQKSGYQLMLYDVTWFEKGGIDTVLGALLDNRVEGIVLISPTEWMPSSFTEEIQKHQIPMVSLGGVLIDGIPHVESDYEQDTHSLVCGLLDAGYKSFLYLTNWAGDPRDDAHSSPRLKRLAGFRRAIAENGGTTSESPVNFTRKSLQAEIFCTPSHVDWTDPYQVGEFGMRQVLARRELPGVVMCANDDWAVGALKACGRESIRVPEMVAVTGHDGTVMSGYGYIPLTTTIQPLPEMARLTIDALTLLIDKKPLLPAASIVKVPGTIAWRASSKAPKMSSQDEPAPVHSR